MLWYEACSILYVYAPKRNYEFLASRPLWSELRAKLVEQAATAIRAAGGHISRSVGAIVYA